VLAFPQLSRRAPSRRLDRTSIAKTAGNGHFF
jgi:hypothetical protein